MRGVAGTGKRASPEDIARREKSRSESYARILDRISEAEFQRGVRETLETLGFIVWVFPVMKHTVAGVPDLTFWHPNRPGRLYCWELKTETGAVRPKQVAALAHLATVPGVDARLVRPSDWKRLRDTVILPAPQCAAPNETE